jgi:L-alanine-DL-glutamate epimerase-like enolase superfamily enzyme
MTEQGAIVAVEAIPIAVTGIRPFRISEGEAATHVSVLLRLLTATPGLEGNAEIVSAPPGKPEEFAEEIAGAIARYVRPALVGRDAMARGAAMDAVASLLKGRIWTKAAVDVALHDLQAKVLGVPVAALLGGHQPDRVPVIGPVVGIMAADAMARMAADQAKHGLRAVKIKVGETPESDIERVRAVREAIGPSMRLRVDANDHYRPADAIRLIRSVERYDVEHVEQPLSRGDWLGMAEVKRKVGIPIMTDDMVGTPADAMTVVRRGAADRVKVKVTKHGLEGGRLIIGMLEAAGIACVLGHVFEMGLAAVAEAHLAATARNLIEPHEIGSLQPMGATADIIADDLRPEPGFMRVPRGPGLGVRIDWDGVEALRLERPPGRRHDG